MPMTFFMELERINLKFIWNHKKTQYCQSNLDKKEQSWSYYPFWLKSILQSYSCQNSMTHKNIVQWSRIESHKKKATLLWSINLQQRSQEYTVEKTVSSISGAGKLDNYILNYDIKTFAHIIYKNKLKVD